jgi:uncharacterized protein (TIGR00661 family)
VARHYPEHEFLFVSHSQGAGFLRRSYDKVLEFISPETLVRHHRTTSLPMLVRNLRFWMRRRSMEEDLLEAVEHFKPDLGIADYEFFVPRVCKRLGIPCLSLDHQHIVTCPIPAIPMRQWPSYVGLYLSVTRLFSAASEFMVVSFFMHGYQRNGGVFRVVPPILREPLLNIQPEDRGHVVSYQSTSTFKGYLPLLRAIGRPVLVYGHPSTGREGNLHFKPPSEEGFLEDLAGCSYVICGGSHTLMSEALHLGKPVFAFPIVDLFEQYLNVHHLQRLGYGRFTTDFRSRPELLRDFEKHLDRYRENIRKGSFCGNDEVFGLLDRYLRYGTVIRPSRAEGGSVHGSA